MTNAHPIDVNLTDSADTSELVDAVNRLATELADTQARLNSVEAENQRLRAELQDVREDSARERADIRQRVFSTEERLDSVEADESPVESPDGSVQTDSPGSHPTPEPGSPPMQEITPLEEVTRLPEHMADSELTANAGRARAVFRDVLDYTESVPKGRAIATPDLRRVLTALRDDGTVCYKTVSRVVNYLTELGQEDVWTTERMNGDTVVVFSGEICRRRALYQNQTDSVVTGQQVAD